MNTAERLKKLRLIRDVSWEKLGEELELGRTMLHYVRSGERELGERALYRLAELEREAGIEPLLTKYPKLQSQSMAIHDAPIPTEEEFQAAISNLTKILNAAQAQLESAQKQLAELKSRK